MFIEKLPWQHWSIKRRLLFIAILPVVLMFLSGIFYTYASRNAEVQGELQERGHFLAHVLAESSLYGVISGNLIYVQSTAERMLQLDQGIANITVLDPHKAELLHISGAGSPGPRNTVFEEPIRQTLIAIDAFEDQPASSAGNSTATRNTNIVGYVRVEMSPSVILARQRQWILLSSVISALVMLISVVLGWMLALTVTRPLATTIAALRHVRAGNFTTELEVTTGGEIGVLQYSIIQMAENLHQATSNLEAKVSARTHDLEIAKAASEKSNEEKKKLIQKSNSVVEEERKRIAAELHDDLNAALTIVRLESQGIIYLAENAGKASLEIKNKASAIIRLTNDLYTLSRNIVRRLRPEVIDTLGLHAAIEEMVHNYDAIHPACRFSFISDDLADCTGDAAITVYRLVQEGLSNVVKHASATQCSVSILTLADKDILEIDISDNGQGFNPREAGPGVGLIGMKERVHGAAGEITIQSRLSVGTKIMIRLPKSHDQSLPGC